MTDKPRPIIIIGPTGVGKTELALNLASQHGADIISADSMQVYRYMDIGTAKPTMKERLAVTHHLIDVVEPNEDFNAALFMKMGGAIIGMLKEQEKNIFVVGGTGLYIRALLGGLFDGPGADRKLRDSYRNDLKKYGSRYLHDRLRDRDQRAADKINPNDSVRIMRALEILEHTGQSIIKKQEEHSFRQRPYDYIKIGLTMNRDALYDRINRRAEKMVEDGLVTEVMNLLEKGFDETLKPMQSMCYRHIVSHLQGKCDITEAIRLVQRDTRHYAKRQLTWFHKEDDIMWFSPTDKHAIQNEIEKHLRS